MMSIQEALCDDTKRYQAWYYIRGGKIYGGLYFLGGSFNIIMWKSFLKNSLPDGHIEIDRSRSRFYRDFEKSSPIFDLLKTEDAAGLAEMMEDWSIGAVSFGVSQRHLHGTSGVVTVDLSECQLLEALQLWQWDNVLGETLALARRQAPPPQALAGRELLGGFSSLCAPRISERERGRLIWRRWALLCAEPMSATRAEREQLLRFIFPRREDSETMIAGILDDTRNYDLILCNVIKELLLEQIPL